MRDRDIIFCGVAVKLLHNRAADAAADTGRHLNETLVNAPAFNIAQHGNAVVNTVYCHVCVITVAAIHRLKDTAGGGEQARTAVLLRNNLFLGFNTLFFEPRAEFIERQDSIDNTVIMLCFIFFCNAGPDKHRFSLGVTPLNVTAMCLHWGKNGCKTGQLARVVFLNQKIHGVAA